jgi:hypothetical protein
LQEIIVSEGTFSLKEIFLMSTQDLDQLIFSFCDENNKLLSKIKSTLNKIIFMNDQSSTFKQFKVKKMPLDNDSFILCFVDYSV